MYTPNTIECSFFFDQSNDDTEKDINYLSLFKKFSDDNTSNTFTNDIEDCYRSTNSAPISKSTEPPKNIFKIIKPKKATKKAHKQPAKKSSQSADIKVIKDYETPKDDNKK